MTENDNGFSFGSPSGASAGGAIDAVEVGGEPVSRNEARHLGLDFGTAKESRDVDDLTSVFSMDRLPRDIGADLAGKLERAWTHLKNDEIEEALTLAQDVVWQQPQLTAARLIIARCFINRGECEKALSILQAIPENEMRAETMYYIGMAQSRLGKVKEAISALNVSRESSPDTLIRKRTAALLNTLHGEQAICSVCGEKKLYGSMIEADGRMICVECANAAESDRIDPDAGGDDGEPEIDFSRDTRRRKRLRRPLTLVDFLLRLILVLLIVGLALYLLYALAPDYYATIRTLIPGGDLILPPSGYASAPAPPRPASSPAARAADPVMEFDSPPLERAIAGLETRHQSRIDGAGNGGSVYTAAFDPVPDGPYVMNPATGELTWTPSARDAGKTFAVTFGASLNNIRAREQRNTVRVSPGLAAKKIGSWPNPLPGSAVHILYGSLTGTPEMVLVSGLYWQGSIAVMRPGQNGENQIFSRMDLAGRPVGAGIIAVGQEKWLAVADFWNSRLRYFVFRNGSLSEIAAATILPGRPVLAAFRHDGSISAVLCRTGAGSRLISYTQTDQLTTSTLGEWTVPDDVSWRDLFVFAPAGENAPPLLVLVAAEAGRSMVFSGAGADGARPLKRGMRGIVLDAAQERGKRRLHLLVEENGVQKLATLDPGDPDPAVREIAVEDEAALGGLAAADISGDGTVDLALLSGAKAGVSFELKDGAGSPLRYWPLTSPPLLFGNPGIMPGDDGEKIVYADARGTLWSLGLAEQ